MSGTLGAREGVERDLPAEHAEEVSGTEERRPRGHEPQFALRESLHWSVRFIANLSRFYQNFVKILVKF